MSKKITAQAVVDQYIETSSILKETTPIGDYRRGNKEYKKIIKIFKILESNLDVAEASLPSLFTHDNVVTRTKAAAHCIALGICIDEAVKVLENVSNDESNGIFGFNAKMTLQVWRERGFLLVYQK